MLNTENGTLALLQSIPSSQRIQLGERLTPERVETLLASLERVSTSLSPFAVLQINSRGGDFPAAKHVCRAIQQQEKTFIGVVAGKAYSGAALILQACKVRIGRPESTYLFHYNRASLPIKFQPFMDTNALKLFLDETFIPNLEHDWQPMHELLLSRVSKMGKTEGELHALLRESRVLTAEEALAWGFLDMILSV